MTSHVGQEAEAVLDTFTRALLAAFDGYSYRYAVLNLAGADEQSLERDPSPVSGQLGFRLEPVQTNPAAAK